MCNKTSVISPVPYDLVGFQSSIKEGLDIAVRASGRWCWCPRWGFQIDICLIGSWVN